jgi:PepSY-associated TM region
MSLAAATFRLHRWLAWLVGLQVLLWICGGLVFSLLPFKAWVKAGDSVRPPALQLPAEWQKKASAALLTAPAAAEITQLQAVSTSQGPAWRVTVKGLPQPLLLPIDGTAWTAPDESSIRQFAQSLYRGDGRLLASTRLTTTPRRLGIVDETAGRQGLWRVQFDDALGTRIYLDARSGEFVAARNEAWVWYDFFWRLHIMDYDGGEDFNGLLLRVSAVLASMLALAGALLAVLAWRRRLRRWRARAAAG